jgi:hypothetical protein
MRSDVVSEWGGIETVRLIDTGATSEVRSCGSAGLSWDRQTALGVLLLFVVAKLRHYEGWKCNS